MKRDPHRDQPILRSGPPLEEAAGIMIMAHGRGGTPRDMLALSLELDRPQLACLAPTAASGSWYPYSFLEPIGRNAGPLNSALRLMQTAMAKAEAAGFPPERVVLLGFSQGACLALEFATRNARRYGGIVGLSGGLIGPEGTPRDYPGGFDGTPVFLGCGDVDAHIPKRRVDETATVLERMGAVVTKRIYQGMGHTVSADEIAAVRALLDGFLANAGPTRLA
jgi:phospholipase/carboxylesterase